jgi:aryl-alcohol dehydrogenase-like predicted oxidoreductase
MIYKKFGKFEWNVSAVAMGTWNIGNQWGNVDEKTAINAITTAFDAGVNLFDTAEGYGIPNGLSEERLAKALCSKRDGIFIASKIGMYGRSAGFPTRTDNAMSIRNSAHASLHRLKTDYHDILFCHEPNPEYPEAYMEAFEMLKKEGRLKLSGVSTDKLDVIKKFNEDGKCDVVEIDYSILEPKHEADLIPYCKKIISQSLFGVRCIKVYYQENTIKIVFLKVLEIVGIKGKKTVRLLKNI